MAAPDPKKPKEDVDPRYTPRVGEMVYARHGEDSEARPHPAMVTLVGQERRLSINLMGKDIGVLHPQDDVVAYDDEKAKGKLTNNFRWYPTPMALELIELKATVEKMRVHLQSQTQTKP